MNYQVNSDQDLINLFSNIDAMSNSDTVTIAHVNIGISQEPIKAVYPGSQGQADLIHLKNNNCIQRYGNGAVIIFAQFNHSTNYIYAI